MKRKTGPGKGEGAARDGVEGPAGGGGPGPSLLGPRREDRGPPGWELVSVQITPK